MHVLGTVSLPQVDWVSVVIVAKKHHLCYMFYAFACAHLSVVSEIAQPMASKGQARTSHFSPYGYGPLAF
jgi:hypothetical protein